MNVIEPVNEAALAVWRLPFRQDFPSFDPRESLGMIPAIGGRRSYRTNLSKAARELYCMLRDFIREEGLQGASVVVHGKDRGKVPGLRSKMSEGHRKALETLLHSLAHIASAPRIKAADGTLVRQRCVAIPLDRNVFSSGRTYEDLSYDSFKAVVMALVKFRDGWLEMVPAHLNWETDERRRTRVAPARDFLDWMVRHELVFPAHPKGPTQAKSLSEDQLLRVSQKRPSGKKERFPLDRPLSDRELVLPKLNEALMKQRLSCPLTNYAQYEAYYNFSEGRPLSFLGGRRAVYRIFSECDGRAGRLHGHWVQHMPAALRSQLKINGKPVAELDYCSMQLMILYAIEEAEVPKGDLYTVKGFSRRDMKAVLTRSVGNPDRTETLRSLERMLWQENRFPKENFPDDDLRRKKVQDRAEQLYEAFWNAHPEVCPHQPSKEAAWAELQKHDSDLALGVIASLLEQGVTPIPIHDSFVVQESYADLTAQVMQDEFTKMFPGRTVRVKRAW